MIGGIFGLIGGLVLIGAGAFVGVFTFGLGFALIGGIGLWIMICSLIVIIAASKLNSEPLEHSKWGAIILVFSIIGSWSLLNLIGGILALVYKPELVGAQQQYVPQQQYGPPQGYAQPQQTYMQHQRRACALNAEESCRQTNVSAPTAANNYTKPKNKPFLKTTFLKIKKGKETRFF